MRTDLPPGGYSTRNNEIKRRYLFHRVLLCIYTFRQPFYTLTPAHRIRVSEDSDERGANGCSRVESFSSEHFPATAQASGTGINAMQASEDVSLPSVAK
jgi:hypothetical protein